MVAFCLTELREATKGILKKSDVEDLEKRIKARVEQRVRERQEGRADALRRSVDDIIEEERKEKEYRKRVAAINIIKNKQVFRNADRFDNPVRGMAAELDGIQGNQKDIRKGAGRLQQANRIKLLEDLYHNLRTEDVFEDFNNIKDERSLAIEMHSPGTISDPVTRKMAKALKGVFETSRLLLNRAGANIQFLEEYIARQTHNPTKLAHAAASYVERKQLDLQLIKQFKGDAKAIAKEKSRIAFERWKNSIKPKLDIVRSFGDVNPADIDTKLKQVYDNIVSGEHQVFTEDGEGYLKFRRSFSASNKLGGKRVLHFKDGGSWYDYQQEYGNGSLHDQFLKQLWDTGGQLGVMEKFGPSARSVYESVKEQLISKNKGIKNIRKKFRHSDWTMDELEGKTRGVPDNLLGKMLMGFKMVRSMNLGSIWLSSIPDFGLSGAKMKSFGGSYLQGEFQAINSFIKGRKDLKAIGSRFGVWSNSTIGASMSRFSSVDSPFSAFAKLNSYITKFNLMEHHDDSIRIGWAANAGKTLGDLSGSKLVDLPEGVRNTLTVHGIGDAEWDLMRHPTNRITSVKNEYIVAPDLVRDFSDKSIAQYLDKPVSELTSSDIFNVKEDMKTNWYNYFADEADDVIPNPSPSSMAWINQGTRGDEFKGILLRLLGQFKSWNIEVTRRTLGKYVFGGGAESVYDAFASGKADISGLAEFILQQMKWGYISAAAVNLSRGLQPPSPFDPKTWVDSAERGGSFGIYLGTLEQAWGKYTGDIGDIFIPPVVGPMRDTTKFLKALFSGDHPLFASTQLAERNFPPLNLFYTRLAFDHMLLYGLMEKSKPGYLKHLESLATRDGNQYWLKPSG
jgi:hypothetical protein